MHDKDTTGTAQSTLIHIYDQAIFSKQKSIDQLNTYNETNLSSVPNAWFHCQLLWFHYVGQLHHGKKNGVGYLLTSYLQFRGEWKDNERNGAGELIIFENILEYMSVMRGNWSRDQLNDKNAFLAQLYAPMNAKLYYQNRVKSIVPRFLSKILSSDGEQAGSKENSLFNIGWYWTEYHGNVRSYLAHGIGNVYFKRTADVRNVTSDSDGAFSSSFLNNSQTLFSIENGKFENGILSIARSRNTKSQDQTLTTIVLNQFENTSFVIGEYQDEWTTGNMGHTGRATLLMDEIDNLAKFCAPFLGQSVLNETEARPFLSWAQDKRIPAQQLSWDGRRVSAIANSTDLLTKTTSEENQQSTVDNSLITKLIDNCVDSVAKELQNALNVLKRMELYWLTAQLRVSREDLSLSKKQSKKTK